MKAKMKMKTRVKVAQYVVRSSIHIKNLENAISGLLTRERFINVTLACDGHRFHCHRPVLAACSPLFEELFTDNLGTHPIVIIPDIKSSTMKLLIEFMYKGQTHVNQIGINALMESAELLQVIGLQYAQTEFKEYLEEEIEEDTNLEYHLFSHTNHDSVDKEIVQEPETQPEKDHDMENHQMTTAIMVTINECETYKKLNEMPKKAIADIIQNGDSQHVVTDSKEFTSTETPVVVMNGSTHALNTTDTVDRIKMEVNTNEKTVEKINNADKCHQTPAAQVTTMPRIRVKPVRNCIHIPTTTAVNQATPKATITEIPYTSTHVLPNDLPPLEKLPNHVENGAQATTSKSVKEVVPPSSSSSSSVASFLKFNSTSMAISVTNLDRNDTQEQIKLFNMPTQPGVNTSAPMEATEQSVAAEKNGKEAEQLMQHLQAKPKKAFPAIHAHTCDKGKIIFHKDNSVFNTVYFTTLPNKGVTQTLSLRNPCRNQPRLYSTDSLFNALMAVKYGGSIYKASLRHGVPANTLRNWMKRWDIKTQFPMPKQLKNAAKKKFVTKPILAL